MSAKKRANTRDEQKKRAGRRHGAGTGEARQPEPEAAAAQAEEAEEAKEAAGAPAEAEAEEAGEVARLQAEVDDLKDQLLRALAETENVRRRGERERQDAAKYAVAPLAKDLLGVADNLRRAVESAPAKEEVADETLKTLLTGVEMTERELSEVFRRYGIEPIEALGRKFDPHRHEAMFEVPDSGQPAGTVVQVLQTGYMLHDRLLRPARVGVAKAAGGEGAAGGGAKGGNVDTQA